jgi:hypothetical protein
VTILTMPAALISSIAILYLLYIFAVLSAKLGAVTKMKPYYRWLYVSCGLVLAALVAKWIILMLRSAPQAAPVWLTSEWLYLVSYTLPLVIAALLALVVVLRYWGWLVREQER